MLIWCCNCQRDVDARLTNGREIYPRREDLAALPFWRCDDCRSYVGCHHKTVDRTKPLGVIPSEPIKRARQHIHALLDPLWRGKKAPYDRDTIYALIAEQMGVEEYHTGEIRTVDEAREVYRVILAIKDRPQPQGRAA